MSSQGVWCLDTWESSRPSGSPPPLRDLTWVKWRSMQRSERKQKGKAFGIPLIVLYLKRCGGDTGVLMHMHTQRKAETRVALFNPSKQQTDGNYRTNQRLKWCIPPLPQPPLRSLAFRDTVVQSLGIISQASERLETRGTLEIIYRQNVQTENYIPQGGTDIQMEYLNNHPRLSKFLKRFQRFLWKILAHWYNTYQQQQRTCENGSTLLFQSPDHLWGDGDQCSPGDAAELWLFVLLMAAADILQHLQAFYYTADKSTASTPAEKECCDIDLPDWDMILEQFKEWGIFICVIVRGRHLKGRPCWCCTCFHSWVLKNSRWLQLYCESIHSTCCHFEWVLGHKKVKKKKKKNEKLLA